MKIANLVLEYIKVILTWPTIILILSIYFCRFFKAPIVNFFSRVTKGQFGMVIFEAAAQSEQLKEVAKSSVPQNQNDLEKYISENPQKFIQEYLNVFKSYSFERIYNIIFGSQISLLEYLSSKGHVGDKYINLFQFYREFLNRTNFNETSFDSYLGYLERSGLIEVKNDNVKILSYGNDFLGYIKTNYLQMYKSKIG